MTDTVEVLARGALIGLGGAAAMDLWGWVARRALGITGLDYALLGRWIGHASRGRLHHTSISAARPIRGERTLGWAAHYAIGITFALLLLVVEGIGWAHAPTLWPALLVGWVTIVVPWFVMQPGMGLGVAASRTPRPGAARLRNLASHTAYGIGLFVSATVVGAVWS